MKKPIHLVKRFGNDLTAVAFDHLTLFTWCGKNAYDHSLRIVMAQDLIENKIKIDVTRLGQYCKTCLKIYAIFRMRDRNDDVLFDILTRQGIIKPRIVQRRMYGFDLLKRNF